MESSNSRASDDLSGRCWRFLLFELNHPIITSTFFSVGASVSGTWLKYGTLCFSTSFFWNFFFSETPKTQKFQPFVRYFFSSFSACVSIFSLTFKTKAFFRFFKQLFISKKSTKINMGSAASTIRKHEASCSDNCVRFVQCFAGMSMKTPTARANRVQAWMVRFFFLFFFFSPTHKHTHTQP